MLEFDVQDMSCGHCASTITKTLKQLDPQAKVEVDLEAKKVRVESGEDRATLAEALTEAGFPPS
jgi:copper chaperone